MPSFLPLWGYWDPDQLPSEMSVWAPPLTFSISEHESFTNHFISVFALAKCLLFLFVLYPTKLSLPLSVPAMVGSASFQITAKLQVKSVRSQSSSCTKKFWLGKSALWIFISVSQLDQFVAGLCSGAPHWEHYGANEGRFCPLWLAQNIHQAWAADPATAPLCSSFKYENVSMWVTSTTSMTNLVSALPDIL